MLVKWRGKDVEIEIENASYDYDYWCDAYICNAYWLDTGNDLTDIEMEEINDYMHDSTDWIISWLY